MTRDEAELEDEFELFMQFSSTDGNVLAAFAGIERRHIGYQS